MSDELTTEVSSGRLKTDRIKRVRIAVYWLPILALWLLLSFNIKNLYRLGTHLLDMHGWIIHSRDTPVWISGNWMVGEYRDCGMLTTAPPPEVALSPQVRAQLPRLFCGEPTESASDFVRNYVSDPRLGQQLAQLGSKGSIDSPAEFAHQYLKVSDLLSFSNATNALFYGGDWSGFESKFHVLPVLYHGRIDRPDRTFVEWRCQRKSDSLECGALN